MLISLLKGTAKTFENGNQTDSKDAFFQLYADDGQLTIARFQYGADIKAKNEKFYLKASSRTVIHNSFNTDNLAEFSETIRSVEDSKDWTDKGSKSYRFIGEQFIFRNINPKYTTSQQYEMLKSDLAEAVMNMAEYNSYAELDKQKDSFLPEFQKSNTTSTKSSAKNAF